MRTLIACQTHIRTADEQKLLDVWTTMRDRIDGRFPDLLVIDSAGPLHARLPAWWNERRILHDDHVPETIGGHTVARFKDALGHPFHDGVLQRSGSDRAFIKMLEIAIASGYDRFAYIEMDLLFALPVQSIFDRMTKPCACGPLVNHGKFPETGLLFLDVEYIWKTGFIDKYNWKGSVVPEGEKRMWNILGDNLEMLPLRGHRDAGLTKPGELAELWPDGIDFLTHAHMGVYADFLRLNNFPELADLCN
jgi:hypothetical protein